MNGKRFARVLSVVLAMFHTMQRRSVRGENCMRRFRCSVRPFLAAFLVITLLLTMNPILIFASQINSYDYQAQGLERPDLISYDQAKKKGHIRRMPKLENENTFVFQNIDGTLTSYTYGAKVQTKDKAGNGRAPV